MVEAAPVDVAVVAPQRCPELMPPPLIKLTAPTVAFDHPCNSVHDPCNLKPNILMF
jgi:hypothetical protein